MRMPLPIPPSCASSGSPPIRPLPDFRQVEQRVAGNAVIDASERPEAPPDFITVLQRDLHDRGASGLARKRRTIDSPQGPRVRVDGRQLIAFASNDYLGLAFDPQVMAAVREGIDRWGAGAGASPLVAGHFTPHAALEDAIAAWVAPCASARALTFSTGYLANLAILTALAGRGDAIFADRLNHACLNDGALLSRAEFVRYPHGDMAALRHRLQRCAARRKIIATDAVFSMDGDIAPLVALLDLATEFDALLVIDDAHGFGVLGDGRGTAAQWGIDSQRLVVMGTLGKAAGIAGAFVAAHEVVIETILQTARAYIYTTAAPAALSAGLLVSLELIREGAARRAHLQAIITRLRDGLSALPWRLLPSITPIQPLLVGDNEAALALAEALWRRGLWVPAIRPPTVPRGTARLRISLSAAHTLADIDSLVAALEAEAPATASSSLLAPNTAQPS
ncbi:MAG: 8-amino-7-oxononanoate synthase [Betaproteobacteria bacterium]